MTNALPGELEDSVLVLKRDSVKIYCNPKTRNGFVRLTKGCSNVELLCQSRFDYGVDGDEDEAFKIGSFVRMTEGVELALVAINADPKRQIPVIEQWPIVQAYAIEDERGGGGRGFFTMRVRVRASLALMQRRLLSPLDSQAVSTVFSKHVSMLRDQWDDMLTALRSAGPARRAKLTPGEVSDGMVTFYEYGLSSVPGQPGAPKDEHKVCGPRRSARVLFGESGTRALGGGGVAKAPASPIGDALHMVARATEPISGISVTRTYLLSNTYSCWKAGYLLLPKAQTEVFLPRPKTTDADRKRQAAATRIAVIYSAAAELVRASIASFNLGAKSHVLTREAALATPEGKRLVGLLRPEGDAQATASLVFRVHRIDAFGTSRSVMPRTKGGSTAGKAPAGKAPSGKAVLRSGLYHVEAAVSGVPGVGSVAFADTVAVNYVMADPKLTNVANTTRDVPEFCSFTSAGDEDSAATKMASLVDTEVARSKKQGGAQLESDETSLGPVLTQNSGFGACDAVITSIPVLPIVRGHIVCFEQGFVLTQCQHGPLAVSFVKWDGPVNVKSVGMTSPVGQNGPRIAVFRVVLKPKESVLSALMDNKKVEVELGVVLDPRARLGMNFDEDVLPAWKKQIAERNISFSDKVELSPQLRAAVDRWSRSTPTRLGEESKLASDFEYFLKDYAISDAHSHSVPPSALRRLSTWTQGKGGSGSGSGSGSGNGAGDAKASSSRGSDAKAGAPTQATTAVSVMLGACDAFKSSLASCVAACVRRKRTAEQWRFLIHTPEGSEGESWNERAAGVRAAIGAQASRSASASGVSNSRRRHVLYVAPARAGAVECMGTVCQTCRGAGGRVHSVVCAVDAARFFADAKMSSVRPEVRAQIVEGFVNVFAIFGGEGGADAKKRNVEVAAYLQAINPTAQLVYFNRDPATSYKSVMELVGLCDREAFWAKGQAALRDAAFPDWDAADAEEETTNFRKKLVALLSKYNPSKLPNVDFLLETFKGREAELLGNIAKKYKGKKPLSSPAAAGDMKRAGASGMGSVCFATSEVLDETATGKVLVGLVSSPHASGSVADVMALLAGSKDGPARKLLLSRPARVCRAQVLDLCQIEGSGVGGKAEGCVSLLPVGALADPKKSYLVFTGTGLDRLGLVAAAQNCLGERRALLSKADVTEATRKEIRAQHILSPPLPSGWNYNGSLFVSAAKSQFFRPDMDAVVDGWLARKNRDIAAFNQALDVRRERLAKELGVASNGE